MTRRKSTGSETDAEAVVAAIEVMSGTFENIASELSMLNETADRIRDELKWLCNEKAEVFRKINRIPLDPADPQWAAKLKAMNGPKESLRCVNCDIDSPESLAAAVLCGWTDLGPDDDDRSPHSFTGLCGTCSAKEQALERIFCTSCEATTFSLSNALRDGWTCLIDDEGNERGDFAGTCGECSEAADSDLVELAGMKSPLNDLFRQVLNCAELNQDDMEPETRELIGKAFEALDPSFAGEALQRAFNGGKQAKPKEPTAPPDDTPPASAPAAIPGAAAKPPNDRPRSGQLF